MTEKKYKAPNWFTLGGGGITGGIAEEFTEAMAQAFRNAGTTTAANWQFTTTARPTW